MSLADDAGQVLEERGGDPGAAALLLGWGRRVRSVARARVHDLEDLMITSSVSYHLVRRVPVTGADPAWVYVRVDRRTGNLALARRQLAGLVLRARGEDPGQAAPAVPSPAPSPSPEPGLPPLPRRRPGALLPAGQRREEHRVGVPAAPRPLVPLEAVPTVPPPDPTAGPEPPPPTVPSPRAGDGADMHVMRRLLAGLRRLV